MAIHTMRNREERQREVAEALHSGEMEGLYVSEAARADAGAYIAGTITSEELITRAEARYGIG